MEADDPRLGLVLQERYRIVRRLGEGGMGCVYEGEHIRIGKRVAIKCLNPEFTQDAQIVERFRREARAATAVGNEHIIDVTDMGDLPDGSPYMVMEFLDGHELAGLLEKIGPMAIGRAVRIVRQVCDALAAAHDAGIVHRDLKPENIYLVSKKNVPEFVKVLDFGISKMQSSPHLADSSLTQTGMAMGTPHYMSPEQAQALKTLDHRTDLYALGVILYRALAGAPPFDAEMYPMLMVQVITQDPRSLRRLRSDVPPALDQVILRCLEKEPEARFASATALSEALAPFAGIDDPPVVPGYAETVRPPEVATVPDGSASAATPVSSGDTASLGGMPPGTEAQGSSGGNVPVTRAVERATPADVPAGSAASSTASYEKAVPGLARGGGGRMIWLLALGLLTVVVLAFVLLQYGPSEELPPTATPSGPAETAPPPSAPSAEKVPAPAPVAVPEEVRVSIVVGPSEAKIFLSDQEFPNPLVAARPRDLNPTKLRLELDGYVAQEHLVVFDRDRDLSYQLVPDRGTDRSSRVRSRNRETPPQAARKGRSRSEIYQGSSMRLRDEW